MTYDAQNGLTWDVHTTKTLWPATNWVAQANTESLWGFDDWRLPTAAELASLPDYGKYPVTPSALPDTPRSIFMSSDLDIRQSSLYFIGVDFNAGFVAPSIKTTPAHVRLVRGVLDTALEWKLLDGVNTWRPAVTDGDWRAPTLQELMTLPDYSKYPVTPTAHPDIPRNLVWSSTPAIRFDGNPDFAWCVDFDGGVAQQFMKSGQFPVVLCKGGAVVPVPVTGYTEAEVRSWYAKARRVAADSGVQYWMLKSSGGEKVFYGTVRDQTVILCNELISQL